MFLSSLTPAGDRALIDRELYLPKACTDDRPRCRAAGIGDDMAFTTKPELARHMLERAVAARLPSTWVTVDEAYGQNRVLRRWLECTELPYVMATRCPSCWERRSAGDGAHGQRLYDWAWVQLAAPGVAGWSAWLLLVRRAVDDGELAFYVAAGPATTTLSELIAVAYQVRTVTDWYRHITLSMLAHAPLAVLRARANTPTGPVDPMPTTTT